MQKCTLSLRRVVSSSGDHLLATIQTIQNAATEPGGLKLKMIVPFIKVNGVVEVAETEKVLCFNLQIKFSPVILKWKRNTAGL